MGFPTDFGDPALFLVLLSVVAAAACLCARWRGAAAWLVATSVTLGTMVPRLLVSMGTVQDDKRIYSAALPHNAYYGKWNGSMRRGGS